MNLEDIRRPHKLPLGIPPRAFEGFLLMSTAFLTSNDQRDCSSSVRARPERCALRLRIVS